MSFTNLERLLDRFLAMKWKKETPSSRHMARFEQNEQGLSIALPGPEGFGMWFGETSFPEGNCCRITVESDAPAEWGNRVGVMAAFKKKDGTFASEDYLEPVVTSEGKLNFSARYDREADVVSIEVRMYLKWVTGTVLFKNVQIAAAEPEKERKAMIVTTRIKAYWDGEDKARRMARITALLERIEKEVKKPDLILFTEEVLGMGLGLSPQELAEPIPGPFSQFISGWARRLHSYIVVGILEQEGPNLRNTACFIGRSGEIVGKYHKVHLTWNESTNGVIPGSTFPVFDLDFGKVGASICWDNWFGECAMALRDNGAELVVVPIAGDGIVEHRNHVWPARASEQGMAYAFAATCDSYGEPGASRIFGSFGEMLAETQEGDGYAAAEMTLSGRRRTKFLSVSSCGEGRSLYVRERRDDLFPLPK